MKGFMKAVVWIIIVVAILVGVYYVLPEYPQSYVKSIIQPMTDSVAKVKIEQVQALTNSDLNNATYKSILESKTKNPCWVYSVDDAGTEHVVFYGRGVQINLKDWEEYNGMLSTSADVKIDFAITGGSKVDIHPYIDNKLMEINDGQHVEKNQEIRLDILSQLMGGMDTLKN